MLITLPYSILMFSWPQVILLNSDEWKPLCTMTSVECGISTSIAHICCSLSMASILKEISPEYSLEGLMLKLKVQYFGHLMQRPDSLEKTLMQGKTEGRGEGDNKGWDCWMASPTLWTWVWVNSGSWRWTGKPGVLQSVGLQRVGHNWAIELIWAWRSWHCSMWGPVLAHSCSEGNWE